MKTRERLETHDLEQITSLVDRHIAAYKFCSTFAKRKRILEIGCGDGYGTRLLARTALRIIGIDKDADPIRIARLQAKRSGFQNISFRSMDAVNLPTIGRFQVIVSLQVIEHIHDLDGYLKSMLNNLSRNGKVIISTPNRELRLLPGQRPWNEFHVREFDAARLRNLLEKYFRHVTLYGLHARNDLLQAEKRRLKLRRIIAALDILHLYYKIPRGFTDNALSVLLRFKKQKFVPREEDKTRSYWASKTLNDALDFIAVCTV